MYGLTIASAPASSGRRKQPSRKALGGGFYPVWYTSANGEGETVCTEEEAPKDGDGCVLPFNVSVSPEDIGCHGFPLVLLRIYDPTFEDLFHVCEMVSKENQALLERFLRVRVRSISITTKA